MSSLNGFSFLVHGASKTGKSTLMDTTPTPRLVLDAEGGASTRFTPSRKVVWDPKKDAPPQPDGTWDTCVVLVREFNDVQRTYDWLNAGKHSFKSVIIDSISETQQRCVDSIVGLDPMKTADWGELLRKMSTLIRAFRDLTIHPTAPITVVGFVAMSKEVEGKWRPWMQGQLFNLLPYYVDVCGYLYNDVSEMGEMRRRLLVAQHPQFEAGDRTGRLGTVIDNPDAMKMLDTIFNGNNSAASGN